MLFLVSIFACKEPPVYAACETVDDCSVPEDATAECLDKSDAGYCTWGCAQDSDCAFEDQDLVCASFESEEAMYCFPPCTEDDSGEECPEGLECRSTGGGSDNRRVCFPKAEG